MGLRLVNSDRGFGARFELGFSDEQTVVRLKFSQTFQYDKKGMLYGKQIDAQGELGRRSEVPVVALELTVHELDVGAILSRLDLVKGMEAGADDFVSKPFEYVELQARVRTILQLNRYRRLLEERMQREQAEDAKRRLPRKQPPF